MSLLNLLVRAVPGFRTQVRPKVAPETQAPLTTPVAVEPLALPEPGASFAMGPAQETRMSKHQFENYDDRFSCPNCEEALPFDEFPQTCTECGFLVEVFLTREDALAAAKSLEEDSDAITTQTYHVYGLGWVLGHTRLLLA